MQFNLKDLIKNVVCLLFLGILAINFTACGGDDDEPSPSETIEDNLPEGANAFVGYWLYSGSSSKYNDFLFLSNGQCRTTRDEVNTGYWTYNKDTQILATTLMGWQFQVTLSNNEAWTGISVSSTSGYSFKRASDDEALDILLCSSVWEDENGEIITTNSNSVLSTDLENTDGCLSVGLSSDGTGSYEFYHVYYDFKNRRKTSTTSKGTIVVKNLYGGPDKTKMIFTGGYEGTWTLKTLN